MASGAGDTAGALSIAFVFIVLIGSLIVQAIQIRRLRRERDQYRLAYEESARLARNNYEEGLEYRSEANSLRRLIAQVGERPASADTWLPPGPPLSPPS